MLNLPKWVQRILDESVCPSCEAKADKNGVFAQGIREEIHPKSKKKYLSFFFLYLCANCKKASTFSGLPTSIEDFVGDMIEVAASPTPTDTVQDSSPFEVEEEGGISNKEIRAVKKFLKQNKFFEDFLGEIGITKSEIERKDDDPEDK